jgi:uncharacterized membrane protein YfcA
MTSFTAEFTVWQWTVLTLGGLAVGLSKTGVPGLGILFVALFANVLPARASTGVVLPLLIFGDLLALASYRHNLVWSHLWRLFPSAAAGVVLGWWALGRLSDAWTARTIGAVLLLMLALHLWRRRTETTPAAPSRGTAAGAGLLAGFTTLVANAAGPVMTIYLLAMRLPKLEFLGTGAVFFFLINWFKVPFMVNLGLINRSSLTLNVWLAPAVLVGAWVGRMIAARIDQKAFEGVSLALAALAAMKLLLG